MYHSLKIKAEWYIILSMFKFLRLIYYWLPPLAWMLIIFYFSSRTRVVVTGEFYLDFLFFKSLHMIEYAALYFLLFRAFFSLNNKQLSINNKFLFPIILSVLYAASDELHQTLVPTREGRLRDIFIDTAGILIMYIYIRSNIKFVKRFLK